MRWNLVHEWAYKPAGIASFSIGHFGGVRAVMTLKTDLLSLKSIALSEMVNIPSLNQFIGDDGTFTPDEFITKSATVMFDHLVRWTKGLKIIKENQ